MELRLFIPDTFPRLVAAVRIAKSLMTGSTPAGASNAP